MADEPDREAAHMRAALYEDLRAAFDDETRALRLATVDDDLGHMADKLWERGWRKFEPTRGPHEAR